MTYSVKEAFITLQGEGYWTGRVAIFLRFAGCNLWSGLERDRNTASCQFCDTDFIGTNGPGGGKFTTASALANHLSALWGNRGNKRYIVCTGGEPLMQLDEPLIEALRASDFEIAVETNGTLMPPKGLDWVCVSPKHGNALNLTQGNELKLVYPQAYTSDEIHAFTKLNFTHFFIQPMDMLGDSAATSANTQKALQFCLENPRWRFSQQTHKSLGIP